MGLLERDEKGVNFTSCSKFKPTVLEGQLCYSLNISSIEKEKTKVVKGEGLVIILDQGVLPSDDPQEEEIKATNKMSLNLGSSAVDKSSARIYLNTLSSFTGHKAGSYAMTALKKMTGTDGFLKQSDEDKKCISSTWQECEAKGYIENVQKRCDCVPWALSGALSSQVC